MKILYWDIENIKYLKSDRHFPHTHFDIIHCSFARPFSNIADRIQLPFSELITHPLQSRGPDVADIHILSLLNADIQQYGTNHLFHLATYDKLLSYRFIVLNRNCSVPHLNIKTLLTDSEIRKRSKKGRGLFEDGDYEKIPDEVLKKI